ncbi:hypothetical protein ACEQ8H_006223 [Pleosporales sp. CAS-2024a]
MLQHSSSNCAEKPWRSYKMKEVTVQLPQKHQRPEEPWQRHLSIDLIWYVLGYTLFHPFVSWVVVLCLRAQYTAYGAPEMRIAVAWSILMSAIGIFHMISERIAFGAPRDVQLADEVIVVTGGVDGLGGLLAETYGMRNANIAVLDTKPVDADEAEEKGVVYYQCDVSDAKQVEAAAAKIAQDLGPPTILINNAGIVYKKSILDTTMEEVEKTFRVNTLSHFFTLQAFLPHMIRQGRGTIVTVSSVLGHVGAANLSAYASSKAALLALHHSLRAELGQMPEAAEIKTILVTPGQMSTRMFADVAPPSHFFAPIATPADLAKSIIRLVDRGESGDVAIPLYSHYIALFSVLPVGIQHLLRRWSGLDHAVRNARSNPSSSPVGKKD